MKRLICLAALASSLLAGCVDVIDDTTWVLNLERTRIVTTGYVVCAPEYLERLDLAVVNPHSAPAIASDSTWSCVNPGNNPWVACFKANFNDNHDVAEMTLTQDWVDYKYTYTHNNGSCTYHFGDDMFVR